MSLAAMMDVLHRMFDEPAPKSERNPDEHRMESLEDWILFGPRMR
jgi:hypothetical protein